MKVFSDNDLFAGLTITQVELKLSKQVSTRYTQPSALPSHESEGLHSLKENKRKSTGIDRRWNFAFCVTIFLSSNQHLSCGALRATEIPAPFQPPWLPDPKPSKNFSKAIFQNSSSKLRFSFRRQESSSSPQRPVGGAPSRPPIRLHKVQLLFRI